MCIIFRIGEEETALKTLRDVPVGGNAKVVKLHGEGGYVDFSCIVTNLPAEEVSVCAGDVETGKTRMFSCSCPMV